MTSHDHLNAAVRAEKETRTVRLGEDRFLDAAVRIGDLLVAEAFHHDGRCSWMGATTDDTDGGRLVNARTALGADLYDGTSGVALFLAELYAASGQRSFRDIAIAAARHAAVALDRQPLRAIGLYQGRVGATLTLWRAAEELDEPGLAKQSVDDVALLAVPAPSEREHDVISGTAGAAIGLVTLGFATERDDLVERAREFGTALLESGEWQRGRLSWRSPAQGRTKNLTGYSHGAAGCAAALLELYAVDGDDAWRDAAMAAFAYEANLYDARECNWPDLREVPRSSRLGPGDLPGTTLWCHGAPGIAVSRIRAGEILGEGHWNDEARTALTTTQRAVIRALEGDGCTWCLCHGVAGNAEILQLGSHLLIDPGNADPTAAALRTAAVGVDQFGAEPATWPCGVREGRTPGLLTGLAGIGRFLLRVLNPAVPSALSISPATWAQLPSS